jgi:hypothetical protein
MRKLAVLSLLLALILLGGQSCSKKYCAAKYPPETITKEVIKEVEKVVVKDTTITITLPADTLTFSDTIYVDKKCQVKISPVVRENERVKVTAYILNNRLFIEVVNKPMAYEITLKKALTERNYWKELAESKIETIKVNEKTRFDRFARQYFWVTSILIFILIGLYLRKLLS